MTGLLVRLATALADSVGALLRAEAAAVARSVRVRAVEAAAAEVGDRVLVEHPDVVELDDLARRWYDDEGLG